MAIFMNYWFGGCDLRFRAWTNMMHWNPQTLELKTLRRQGRGDLQFLNKNWGAGCKAFCWAGFALQDSLQAPPYMLPPSASASGLFHHAPCRRFLPEGSLHEIGFLQDIYSIMSYFLLSHQWKIQSGVLRFVSHFLRCVNLRPTM